MWPSMQNMHQRLPLRLHLLLYRPQTQPVRQELPGHRNLKRVSLHRYCHDHCSLGHDSSGVWHVSKCVWEFADAGDYRLGVWQPVRGQSVDCRQFWGVKEQWLSSELWGSVLFRAHDHRHIHHSGVSSQPLAPQLHRHSDKAKEDNLPPAHRIVNFQHAYIHCPDRSLHNQLLNDHRHCRRHCRYHRPNQAILSPHTNLLHHKLVQFPNRRSQLLHSGWETIDLQVVCSEQLLFLVIGPWVCINFLCRFFWQAKCCGWVDARCNGCLHDCKCVRLEVPQNKVLDIQPDQQSPHMRLPILHVRLRHIIDR